MVYVVVTYTTSRYAEEQQAVDQNIIGYLWVFVTSSFTLLLAAFGEIENRGNSQYHLILSPLKLGKYCKKSILKDKISQTGSQNFRILQDQAPSFSKEQYEAQGHENYNQDDRIFMHLLCVGSDFTCLRQSNLFNPHKELLLLQRGRTNLTPYQICSFRFNLSINVLICSFRFVFC